MCDVLTGLSGLLSVMLSPLWSEIDFDTPVDLYFLLRLLPMFWIIIDIYVYGRCFPPINIFIHLQSLLTIFCLRQFVSIFFQFSLICEP